MKNNEVFNDEVNYLLKRISMIEMSAEETELDDEVRIYIKRKIVELKQILKELKERVI